MSPLCDVYFFVLTLPMRTSYFLECSDVWCLWFYVFYFANAIFTCFGQTSFFSFSKSHYMLYISCFYNKTIRPSRDLLHKKWRQSNVILTSFTNGIYHLGVHVLIDMEHVRRSTIKQCTSEVHRKDANNTKQRKHTRTQGTLKLKENTIQNNNNKERKKEKRVA